MMQEQRNAAVRLMCAVYSRSEVKSADAGSILLALCVKGAHLSKCFSGLSGFSDGTYRSRLCEVLKNATNAFIYNPYKQVSHYAPMTN